MARPSSRSYPVSFEALGGLAVPPPDFYRSLHPSLIKSCCECSSTELFLRSLDPQWRLLRVLHLAPSSVAPFHTLGAEVALRVAYCGHRPVHVVRPSCGMPVSFEALGGLSVPPPDFYRPLRPRPDNKVGKVTQVNRAVVQESTHSAQVSWFISLAHEQSLYPGRPRGGLTIVPSRYPTAVEYRPSVAEGFVAQYPLKR